MIFLQIIYVASDLSKPSTTDAVSLGLAHRGATQHRSKLSDNFFFLPEIFREIDKGIDKGIAKILYVLLLVY